MGKASVPITRRTFLAIGASGLVAGSDASASSRQIRKWSQIKAGAFDAFPVFDSRPILRACEEAFPGRGSDLSNAWRTRQFEYQWLRALAGQYEDFWRTPKSALDFAAHSVKLELSSGVRDS